MEPATGGVMIRVNALSIGEDVLAMHNSVNPDRLARRREAEVKST